MTLNATKPMSRRRIILLSPKSEIRNVRLVTCDSRRDYVIVVTCYGNYVFRGSCVDLRGFS